MADITFDCPECKGNLIVSDEGVGLTVQCPHCSAIITIPGQMEAAVIPSQAASPQVADRLSKIPIRWSVPVSAGLLIILVAFAVKYAKDNHAPSVPPKPVVAPEPTGLLTVSQLSSKFKFFTQDSRVDEVRCQLHNDSAYLIRQCDLLVKVVYNYLSDRDGVRRVQSDSETVTFQLANVKPNETVYPYAYVTNSPICGPPREFKLPSETMADIETSPTTRKVRFYLLTR